jgi:hypothetical protein
VEPSPPPKGGWELTLSAIRQYFPHVGPEFVEKLRVAIIQHGVRQYTDLSIAESIHKARKARRNQQSEGLFLHTVPEILAAAIETNKPGIEAKIRQEWELAREILSGKPDPLGHPWSEADEQWARKVLS